MNLMDESSEEEHKPYLISEYTDFDESVIVKNAEEIKSPVIGGKSGMKKRSKNVTSDSSNPDVNSPRGKKEFRRYSQNNEAYLKTMGMDSESSDSGDTDEIEMERLAKTKPVEFYDPKQFDDIEASTEVKELFQNIIRYTPQKTDLNYKLIPFIPDYIPAVGDIDAFLKIPRPDGVTDKIGLTVLDEPCANQSEPAVLHLQLRSQSKSAGASRQSVIKRIEDAERNGKLIDKWIEDMNQLHRSKHPPAVTLSKPLPDIDALMQQWPNEVEEKLTDSTIDFSKIDCELPRLVDIVCNLLDIPVHENARLESLHTLFTLFLEVRTAREHRFLL